jgi:hypothetical protein
MENVPLGWYLQIRLAVFDMDYLIENPRISEEDYTKLVDAIVALQEAKSKWSWRPIYEMHEGHGDCVVVDLRTPEFSGFQIKSRLDLDFREAEWTHFAELPKLTSKFVEKFKMERAHAREADSSEEG